MGKSAITCSLTCPHPSPLHRHPSASHTLPGRGCAFYGAAGGIVPTASQPASQPPCPSGGEVLPRAASGQWLGMVLVEPPFPKALPDGILITPITTTTKYSKSIHRQPVLSSRLGPPFTGCSCAFQDGRLQCLSFQLRSGFQVFFHSQLRGCSL